MRRLLVLGLVMVPSVAAAQDYTGDVAGWTMSDIGHQPNDDSERFVVISKRVPGVSLVYGPNGKGHGGSFKANFAASKGCRGLEYNVAYDFEPTKVAPVTLVRNDINGMFAEFREQCPGTAVSAADLLNGFDTAFAAVHQRVADKPYVFPPAPAPVAPAKLWRQPPFTRPMAQVLRACGIDRRQAHYFNGVEDPGYAIRLTRRQYASSTLTQCLDRQIRRRNLTKQLFVTQPFPDRT